MGKALDEQLIISIKQNNLKKTASLISSGSDINAKDKDGNKCLDWGIAFADDEMIELLITKGADDSDARIAGFMTCQSSFSDKQFGSLIYAISQGSMTIALALLESGVTIIGKPEKEKEVLSNVIANSFALKKITKQEMDALASHEGFRFLIIKAFQKNREQSITSNKKKNALKKQPITKNAAPANKKAVKKAVKKTVKKKIVKKTVKKKIIKKKK